MIRVLSSSEFSALAEETEIIVKEGSDAFKITKASAIGLMPGDAIYVNDILHAVSTWPTEAGRNYMKSVRYVRTG